MTDILRGFIQLVKQGVIHRDLKPANILLHSGIYKLAGFAILNILKKDFGFAKCVLNLKREMLNSSVGTPLYMSP
jgi:calcium-dependent protein kinase